MLNIPMEIEDVLNADVKERINGCQKRKERINVKNIL